MFIEDAVGTLGSLDNGTAPSKVRADRLPFCRNFERASGKALKKRPGRLPIAEIASVAENSVAPPLTNLGAAGSSLSTGTLYVRLTYSTVPGETDDLHSTGNSIAVSSGESVKVWVPFHIINREVQYHDVAAGTIRLKDYFNTQVLEEFADDTFNNWLVYVHDPSVGDESGLGVNLEGFKLWDRLEPDSTVTDFTASNYTFTLSTAIAADLTGRRVSILMPGQANHPIRAANVYVSQNSSGPFYIYESVAPSEPTSVTVTSIPTSNRQSPETRITRTAPTVSATTATYVDPLDGVTKNGNSGLFGGEYIIRYAWETSNAAHLDNGQWPDAESFGLCPRPRRGTQFSWPSKAARVSLSDDQAISVTLPTFPSGAERALVSCRRVGTVYGTLTFSGLTNPANTHRAYKYSPASGTGSASALALSPSDFRASGDVSEVSTANYTALTSADQSYYTSVSTLAVNKTQLEYQLSAGQQSNTTTALLVIGMKGVATAEHSPPSRPRVSLRYWNANSSAWVTLKDDITAGETRYRLRRLAVAFNSNMLESGRLVLDISGQAGAGYSIDYAKLELYSTSLATDPDIVTTGIARDSIVEDTTSTSVTIKHPLLPASRCEPLRTNTTAQWPVSQYAAYIGTDTTANPAEGVWHLIGSADAIFLGVKHPVNISTSLRRIYSHERPNGLTSKNTLEVAATEWRFTNSADRVFICNSSMDGERNLRFDGVQTHPHGLLAPPSAAPPPADDGSDTPEPDPSPDDTGIARYEILREMWAPDRYGRPVETGSSGEIVSPYREPRWAVKSPDYHSELKGRWAYIFDLRDLTYASSADRERAMDDGLAGRVIAAFRLGRNSVRSRTALVEIESEWATDVIRYLMTRPAASPSSNETSTDNEAETAADELPSGGVPAGKKHYYVKAVRMLGMRAKYNGYSVRSGPVRIATVDIPSRPAVVTTNEDGSTTTSEATGSKITLKVRVPSDPSVTHLEVYRSLTDSEERAKMTERVEVEPAAVDADGFITVIDDKSDDQLTLDMHWDTRHPPSSAIMRYTNSGRCWGVPKYNLSAVWFSNLNSESGLPDPEGVSPYNVQVPQLERPAPINALGVYADQIVVHTDNGMALQTGSSDDLLSGDPITFRPVFSDKGAMGAEAWANWDGYHYFMTKFGLYRMLGAEVSEAEPSGLVGATIEKMSKTAMAAAAMSMEYHRKDGKSQLWCTYSLYPHGMADNVLVLEAPPSGSSEESGKEWRDWTEMWAHSLARVEQRDGSEPIIIGDRWGRLFMHGMTASDAGLHIDCELRTRPFALGGEGRSFAPRFLFVEAKGKSGHWLQFDFLKDLTGTRSNDRIQRFDLQGQGSNQWGDIVWGDFTWGESKHTGYREHRAHIGRVFRQLQLSMGQRWQDMPPGARRDQTVEIAGYRIAARGAGYRRVGA